MFDIVGLALCRGIGAFFVLFLILPAALIFSPIFFTSSS